MIAPTIDKKEYFEAMKSETHSDGSYSNLLGKNFDRNFDFKSLLVKSQWNYAKKQLDSNETPRTFVERGDLYLLRKNYKKAIDHYQKSLVLDPDYIPAYEKIIEAYVLHNRHPDALIYFEELLDKTNRRKDVFKKYILFRVDLQFLHGGDVDDTLKIIKDGIEVDKHDCELLNTYGFIVLNFKEQLDEAETYFDRVLAIDPNFIHSVNNKGICQLRTERLDEAEKSFLNCIEIAPRSYPFSYQNLSFLYVKNNNLQKALDTLILAKDNKVTLDNARDHLYGWLMIQLDKFSDAATWYEAKIKEEPNNQLLLNNLGFCYASLGKKVDAENKFQSAIKISELKIRKTKRFDKRALTAYYNLGRLANSRKDTDETIRIANRIIDLNSNDAFAQYLLGSARTIEREYDKAKKLYAKALELDENIPEAYPDYAFILSSIDKDYTEAITVLEKSLRLGFQGNLVINNLAHAHIQNGSLETAENIITEIKALRGLSPVLTATSGLLEMRKGNLKKGNRFYEEAIKTLSDPYNKVIAEQIQMTENAKYYLDKKNYEKCEEFLVKAKKFPKSYVTSDIKEIEDLLPIKA